MRPVECIVIGSLILPSAAYAASDELVVAAEPGYGLLVSGDVTQHGAGGTFSAWVGLTDTLWLGLSGGAFAFAGHRREPSVTQWETTGGLVATLDVFRWVPYIEGQLGVVGHGSELAPTVRLGLGVDYLVSPRWFVGLVARTRPLADPLGDVLMTIGLRAGLRYEL